MVQRFYAIDSDCFYLDLSGRTYKHGNRGGQINILVRHPTCFPAYLSSLGAHKSEGHLVCSQVQQSVESSRQTIMYQVFLSFKAAGEQLDWLVQKLEHPAGERSRRVMLLT